MEASADKSKTVIKAGWKKIQFCAKQAAADGLQYFWIDTCCTIQTHHRGQCPTKRVAYADESGGRICTGFQYKSSSIYSYSVTFSSENPCSILQFQNLMMQQGVAELGTQACALISRVSTQRVDRQTDMKTLPD
jgi:hypothetical protein